MASLGHREMARMGHRGMARMGHRGMAPVGHRGIDRINMGHRETGRLNIDHRETGRLNMGHREIGRLGHREIGRIAYAGLDRRGGGCAGGQVSLLLRDSCNRVCRKLTLLLSCSAIRCGICRMCRMQILASPDLRLSDDTH